ncbi:MAG: cyclic pyranopterin monophosphate synthase MoaC, partial [Abditibacteriaceae bacterium]
MTDFSHLNKEGKPTMVDVSEKKITKRSATARSIVVLPQKVLDKFHDGDITTKKGSVFQIAIIAG